MIDEKKDKINEMRVGDTIRVYYKFVEKDKERVQSFEGIVIAQKGAGASRVMTLRGMLSAGVMMEKTMPIHSPNIQKIEIVKKGKARRAKLYYLRNMTGKKAKLKKRTEKPSLEKKEEEEE